MPMILESSAFHAGAQIPAEYTADGANLSPPLSWSGAPPGTRAFVLVTHDPDAPAGDWVHWVLYDIPADHHALAKGVPASERLSDGGTQGVNDFHRVGWGGPSPPRGPVHHYAFDLYALDRTLGLPARQDRRTVLRAVRGHVLAEAHLVATYRRP